MDSFDCENNLARLVEDYHESLYRFAYRMTGSSFDAEDLTQETFMTAHSKLGQLRDPSSVKAWLFTVLRNHFRKRLRNQKGVKEVSLENVGEPVTSELYLDQIESEELQLVLNQIAEEYRIVVILYYFEELSYKEISSSLDIPIGTVMSRLSRAKQFLRSQLVNRGNLDSLDSVD